MPRPLPFVGAVAANRSGPRLVGGGAWAANRTHHSNVRRPAAPSTSRPREETRDAEAERQDTGGARARAGFGAGRRGRGAGSARQRGAPAGRAGRGHLRHRVEPHRVVADAHVDRGRAGEPRPLRGARERRAAVRERPGAAGARPAGAGRRAGSGHQGLAARVARAVRPVAACEPPCRVRPAGAAVRDAVRALAARVGRGRQGPRRGRQSDLGEERRRLRGSHGQALRRGDTADRGVPAWSAQGRTRRTARPCLGGRVRRCRRPPARRRAGRRPPAARRADHLQAGQGARRAGHPAAARTRRRRGRVAALLELLQFERRQEAFDDRAIEYAIAFEQSPPSWEPAPAPATTSRGRRRGAGRGRRGERARGQRRAGVFTSRVR